MTVLLPATGVKAPNLTYSVSQAKTFETSRGISVTGKIKRGNKIVGLVEDRGDGGALHIFFNTADEHKKFDEYVAEWTWTWVNPFGGATNSYNEEDVFNALIQEELFRIQLNKYATKGTVVTSDPIDAEPKLRVYHYKIEKGDTDTAGIANLLALNAGDSIWNTKQWLTVTR